MKKTQQVHQIWKCLVDIGKTFLQYQIVMETVEQGICLLNARIALTIMGQATRLFVLQKKQGSQILENCRKMAKKLFPSTTTNNYIDGKVTQFINDVGSGGESIDIIFFSIFYAFSFQRTLCSKTTGHYWNRWYNWNFGQQINRKVILQCRDGIICIWCARRGK